MVSQTAFLDIECNPVYGLLRHPLDVLRGATRQEGFFMLTIDGHRHRCCDGQTRRNILQIGSPGKSSLALPMLLGGQAASESGGSAKSVINILLPTPLKRMDYLRRFQLRRSRWRATLCLYPKGSTPGNIPMTSRNRTGEETVCLLLTIQT